MKNIITTIVFVLFIYTGQAGAQIIIQNAVDTTEQVSDKLYKFELRLPAQCIDKLIYQKDGSKVEYELDHDLKTVFIRNYIPGRGVRVECTYQDGSRDAFNKSPCSIELVVPL